MIHSPNLIEREFLRKKLYNSYIIFHFDQLKSLYSTKYRYEDTLNTKIRHLAIRYIFNKNMTKTYDDDPVFITSDSPLAKKQLFDDLTKTQMLLDDDKAKEFIKHLEIILMQCSKQVKQMNLADDDLPTITENNEIRYKHLIFQDFSNLAKKFPKYIHYAVALQIRYTYLHLQNHGLAREFNRMNFIPTDSITEGFATAFDHYFDKYCSPFPDLETPFGSTGSFFSVSTWDTDIIYINPPFDETLIECTINHVYEQLKVERKKRRYIFTLPNWNHFPALEHLKLCYWLNEIKTFKKGHLNFINYYAIHGDPVEIAPCDIVEITLMSSK